MCTVCTCIYRCYDAAYLNHIIVCYMIWGEEYINYLCLNTQYLLRVRILPEVLSPNDRRTCSWTPSCMYVLMCMQRFFQTMHTCPAHRTTKVSTIWKLRVQGKVADRVYIVATTKSCRIQRSRASVIQRRRWSC